jgi:UDP-3-O-[3-hydroxymyristoyl] N-acetylglucosamine deacetylase
MSILNQKTLNNPVKFYGIGLHSGKPVKLTVKPSEPNTGIIFMRVDLKKNNLIYPNFANVSNTSLNTTISNNSGVKVSTIEHLMGAFFGLGIDNALVEIDNEEVPILDGSSKEFVNKILKVGFNTSNNPIKIVKIRKKIQYREKDRYISIEPSRLSLKIDYTLKYKNSIIGKQQGNVNVYEDNLSEIYHSRTFCLYEDIEKIKKMGLAKGGSLDNAIVVQGNAVLNNNGLRNKKEFVNHKILDCIGDLYTCGYRIIGNVKCIQGGHYLTNKLLNKVFSDKENYSIVEIKENYLPHSYLNRNLLRTIA